MVWYGHNCGSCANSNKSPDMFWNLDPIRNVKNRRCCALSVSVLSGLAQLLGNKNLKTKGRRKQEKNGDFYCSFYCCQQLKMSRHSLRDFIFSLWGLFQNMRLSNIYFFLKIHVHISYMYSHPNH